MDGLRDVVVIKRKLAYLFNTLEEEEKHVAPRGTFRERKKPRRLCSYIALMSHIFDVKPTSFEEVVNQQVWKDAMMDEYQSIMKKDIGDCSKT